MIKGCSYLKSAASGVRKGFIFPKENYCERIVNRLKVLKVILSRKDFGFIYVARRDVFLHSN